MAQARGASSSAEQIGVHIASTYDDEGVAAARADVSALGKKTSEAQLQLVKDIDRIPGKARTAANALSSMAFAAANGQTMTRGLATAAGSAADSISILSGNARIAASAAGIGALITVAVAVVALLDQMEAKAKAAGKAIAATLGDFTDQAFEARAQAVETAYELAQQKLEQLSQGGGPLGIDINIPAQIRAKNELERLTAAREAIEQERLNRTRQARRDAADETEEQEKRDAERAKELLKDLTTATQEAYDQRTESAAGAARLKAERLYIEHRKEIDLLLIGADEKNKLIEAAQQNHAEAMIAIDRDAAYQRNQIEEQLFRQQQDRHDRALELVKDQMESALHAAIMGRESFIQAATRTLLTPLVKRLEALAVEQGIEALAEAAFGNFIGAARHAAVAAAAIAAAQKIAVQGGLTASAPSTGALNGGVVGRADSAGSGGNVTVVIQTVDPTSRAVINEVGYQLQRGGILKQPFSTGGYSTEPLVKAA